MIQDHMSTITLGVLTILHAFGHKELINYVCRMRLLGLREKQIGRLVEYIMSGIAIKSLLLRFTYSSGVPYTSSHLYSPSGYNWANCTEMMPHVSCCTILHLISTHKFGNIFPRNEHIVF